MVNFTQHFQRCHSKKKGQIHHLKWLHDSVSHCFWGFSFWQRILVIFCYKQWQNFKVVNVSTNHSMFKTKISICVSTLKNSMIRLFVATSVQQGCSKTVARRVGQNEWRRFTGSYRLPSKSECFPPESREPNRERSVSARPCLCGILSKVPVQLMDTVWAESVEGYSQSVSVPSFESMSAPSKHFLNTRPPTFWQFLVFCQFCLSLDLRFCEMFLKEKATLPRLNCPQPSFQ